MTPISHRHTIGIHRRELLQVGFSGLLGIGLPTLPAAAWGTNPSKLPSRSGRQPKSVILVFLTGAPSHIDTFDPKPDAAPEIRGEFKTIATSVPGLLIGEHLPRLAARAGMFALVRSLSHHNNNHLNATHHVLTGAPQPGAFFDKVASRNDWPGYSSALSYLSRRSDGVPTGVNLPTFLVEGPLTWPGQHAGFLGPRYDPWQISRNPNGNDFRVANLDPGPGLEISRLSDRWSLLQQVDQEQARFATLAEGRRLTDQQNQALSILTSRRIARAFAIEQEPAVVRDRYGRHPFGQSLLLARRLVQAGVRVVQANMGRVQNWDSHGDIFPTLKDRLLPPLDQGVSALLDDLAATGLLDETLLLMLGEFGRAPKLSMNPGQKRPGRDHWARCFSGVFAGAGVRGGQVIGKSDPVGAYPITAPFSPDDIGATVYHVLGVDPATEVHDRFNRPVRLNRGDVMECLFTGRS